MKTFEQNGRVAIVTGASKGIGAAIVEKLAQEGFAVIVNFASNESAADDVVKKIQSFGGRATAIKADVSSDNDVAALFARTIEIYGQIDVLVNNAGIMQLAKIIDSDDHLVDQHIAINLKGTINTLRQAGIFLNNGGRVINFSTSVVGLYQEGYGIYAATKAAVEALTHVFAKEMGPKQITVNAIAPGPTATDLFLNGKSDELLNHIISSNPLGRLGQPCDIAEVVAFLAKRESGWINGQIIRVNGGII